MTGIYGLRLFAAYLPFHQYKCRKQDLLITTAGAGVAQPVSLLFAVDCICIVECLTMQILSAFFRRFCIALKEDQPVENFSPSLLEKDSFQILREALERLEAGFSTLPPATSAIPGIRPPERIVFEVAGRLNDNCPYSQWLYAGNPDQPV